MWGRSRRDKAVVRRFVDAVNAHDPEALEPLLAPDFTYIDSWREGITGRDIAMAGMRAMFAGDPGFGIEVDTMDYRDPFVLMTGRVNSRNFGHGRRAVWQVLVKDEVVQSYQSWAEGGPPPMVRMLSPDHARDMTHQSHPRPDPDAGEELGASVTD